MKPNSTVVARSLVDGAVGPYWSSTSSRVIIHENFNPNLYFQNDIALVKLLTAAPKTGKECPRKK
jgi:hypothetical protein